MTTHIDDYRSPLNALVTRDPEPPMRGDQVRVTYEAVYQRIGETGRHVLRVIDEHGSCSPVVPASAEIVVLARSPRVGDVMTKELADGLPNGSIMEYNAEDVAHTGEQNLAMKIRGEWLSVVHPGAELLFDSTSGARWTVSRVGYESEQS